MTRLGTLGYSQRLLMDHSGEYDNFLQSMRDKAGVTATLDNAEYPTRYMNRHDTTGEIADSLAVLRHWQRTQVKSKAGRTAHAHQPSRSGGATTAPGHWPPPEAPSNRVPRRCSTTSAPSCASLNAPAARR